MGLLKLAERLEHASGEYDPLLCSDIHDVLPEPKCVQPPNYCASLDAAETLVPEYCKDVWSLIGGTKWQALVGLDDYQADAATPALALCAAALRARASNG